MKQGTVGITMDLDEAAASVYDGGSLAPRVPAPGDILVTLLRDGTWGSAYQIVTAREVRRRAAQANAVPRFALRCRRTTKPPWPIAPDWLLRWYPRRRR